MRAILVHPPSGKPPLRFEKPFRIGRKDDAGVCIKDDFVSRYHAEVTFEAGQWWVKDLDSANGIFVDGKRLPRTAVGEGIEIRLGVDGPFVRFAVQPAPAAKPARPPEQVADVIGRYFQNANGPAGEHTILVREAFAQVQRKQKRRYGWVVAALVLVALGAGAYAWRLRQVAATQTAAALDMFYAIKSLDVDIAGVEMLLADTGNQTGAAELAKYRSRRQDMEKNYDKFLDSLHVYDAKMTPQHRLVMRIARIFGESELAMPPDFLKEVDTYIAKWKASDRMANALLAAQNNNVVPFVVNELLARGLPPQFIYLAMQESNFDPLISGPPTRSGIAKGMWQFVPETAVKYGLNIGPLAELRRPDPADDRHHWELATKAAANYLKDLYRTDAQASGFLVMSCYNWGEDRVLPLVRKMPANPKERNFWKLLALGKQRIPKETYDYVFYIVSAAVIGENPRLFGFNFDNPLGYLDTK